MILARPVNHGPAAKSATFANDRTRPTAALKRNACPFDSLTLTKVQGMAQKWYYAEGQEAWPVLGKPTPAARCGRARAAGHPSLEGEAPQQWAAAGSIRGLFPVAPAPAVPAPAVPPRDRARPTSPAAGRGLLAGRYFHSRTSAATPKSLPESGGPTTQGPLEGLRRGGVSGGGNLRRGRRLDPQGLVRRSYGFLGALTTRARPLGATGPDAPLFGGDKAANMTKEEFYAKLKTFKEVSGVNWQGGQEQLRLVYEEERLRRQLRLRLPVRRRLAR